MGIYIVASETYLFFLILVIYVEENTKTQHKNVAAFVGIKFSTLTF